MRSRVFWPSPSLLLAALLSLAACDRSSTVAGTTLPPGFSERSDVPYISGSIVERTDVNGVTTLLVRVPRGTTARVPEARVTVGSPVIVKWTDGRAASPRELRVGRRVTVWVTGAELRSLPPQVTGNGFLLTR